MTESGVIALVSIGLSAIVSIAVSWISAILGYKINKKKEIFNDKKACLLDALVTLEHVIAKRKFVENGKQIVPDTDIKLSDGQIADKARECIDKLAIYCVNPKIAEIYMDVVVNGNTKPDNYNLFRNLCRKELGLKDINLGSQNAFLVGINTNQKEGFN